VKRANAIPWSPRVSSYVTMPYGCSILKPPFLAIVMKQAYRGTP
jgi:hypothetical protein